MNIIIFTNRDLASNINLNLLLPHISEYVTHVFVSDKVGGKNSDPPKELKELKFFEQTLFNDILFPQLDNQNREFKGQYLTFNELSKKYNIPIQSLNEVKSVETLDYLRSLKPDLILSVRYGKIFGNDFIKIPKQGVINLHSGLLPQYRGVLATFRALMNGDSELGCTLHYIDDATIDTGGIIGFSNLKVDKTKSLFWHIMNLYPASLDILTATIDKISLQGTKQPLETLSQTDENAQYFTFPTHEEVAAFKEKGWSFMEVGEYEEIVRRYV
jgi:methionyl-tRNA formyltransferase